MRCVIEYEGIVYEAVPFKSNVYCDIQNDGCDECPLGDLCDNIEECNSEYITFKKVQDE